MEHINIIKIYIVSAISIITGGFINLIGGWTEDLTTLIIVMSIDFILGLAIAGIWKRSGKSKNGALDSWSAWKGLIRKGASLAVVLIAYRLDVTLGFDYIRTTVIIGFILNEVISIVENLGIIGVPLPGVIHKAIDVLKKKTDKEGK
jgi:toxin secretion/phage lysis holin